MRKQLRTPIGAGALVLITGLAAACGSSSSTPAASGSASSSSSSSSGSSTPSSGSTAEHNVLPGGTIDGGVKGGTLKIVGSGDVDHLDTASAYYTTTYELFRGITRQLVSYPTSNNATTADTPVPDLATYTISPDKTTYTFKIKPGVMWDAPSGPRQITSADEVLGIKRLCNPVSPAAPIQYWTNTIKGMDAFCTPFGKVVQTASAIKSYIDSHQISGITTPDSSTVVFHLISPASDFLNIMALPFSSPAPVEDLNYVPDSPDFRTHFISDGPYTITKYVAKSKILLARNPAWQAKTDPLRHAYVDSISVTEGETDTSVQQQLQTGGADLEWDTVVPSAQVHQLVVSHSKNLLLSFNGSISYMPFNLQSKSDGGALAKPAVRQALQYCVNKQHLIQIGGGSDTAVPATQILSPQITGYQKIDPYATPNSAGDPAKCKSMLAAAGYPKGVTLKLAYSASAPNPAEAQALQSDMAKAGVTIQLVQQQNTGAFYNFIETPSNAPKWDLAFAAWAPDWQGNAARSFFVPLLDGRAYGPNSTDYGDYNNPTVNADITKALSATSLSASTADWAAADKYAMTNDPPWVPLSDEALPQFYGTGIKGGTVYNNFISYLDITNVWVK